VTTATGSIERRVPARVGLVGNPSDGYGGAVLATVVPGMAATASASVSTGVAIGDAAWPSIAAWLDAVETDGHGDHHRIISAALWSLVDHLDRRGDGVELRWSTDIPRSVGLAGSSALAVAVIDATAVAWGVELDRRVIAALALRAERDVLGIAAGWQDRIVQAYGRTVLVDTATMDHVDGVDVPVVRTPSGPSVPLLLAWHEAAATSSDDYHAPLRQAAASLAEPMAELGELARAATAAWEDGDADAVARAIDQGWRLRQACAPLRPEHAALVDLVRAEGLAATTPGSGGAVVSVCADDDDADIAIEVLARAGCSWLRFDLT
jgi:glucuronokinase